MRILFLNQYFPPDPAPTGVLLRELGEHFAAQGHECRYLASPQSYRAAGKNRRRMLRELGALGSILWRGMREPRPDVVFSTTSPPCLLVVATLIARRHRARSAHWLMDMYPELALALGEIRRGALSQMIERMMGWAYRQTGTLVALDADMAARLEKYGVLAETLAPWLMAPFEGISSAEPEAPPTWIYSGNLGRAHEWETLLQAQAVLEKRGAPWRLLFQGGGPAWPAAQARAAELGLRQCEWAGYAAESALRDSLARCDVLVATQRPETQGLLWPSKLALMRDVGRPILWIGPVDGAISEMLRESPGAGIFSPGDGASVAAWLMAPREPMTPASPGRAAGLAKWARLLTAR